MLIIFAEIVAVRCLNFGQVHTVILTIDYNTEIIKNEENINNIYPLSWYTISVNIYIYQKI